MGCSPSRFNQDKRAAIDDFVNAIQQIAQHPKLYKLREIVQQQPECKLITQHQNWPNSWEGFRTLCHSKHQINDRKDLRLLKDFQAQVLDKFIQELNLTSQASLLQDSMSTLTAEVTRVGGATTEGRYGSPPRSPPSRELALGGEEGSSPATDAAPAADECYGLYVRVISSFILLFQPWTIKHRRLLLEKYPHLRPQLDRVQDPFFFSLLQVSLMARLI